MISIECKRNIVIICFLFLGFTVTAEENNFLITSWSNKNMEEYFYMSYDGDSKEYRFLGRSNIYTDPKVSENGLVCAFRNVSKKEFIVISNESIKRLYYDDVEGFKGYAVDNDGNIFFAIAKTKFIQIYKLDDFYTTKIFEKESRSISGLNVSGNGLYVFYKTYRKNGISVINTENRTEKTILENYKVASPFKYKDNILYFGTNPGSMSFNLQTNELKEISSNLVYNSGENLEIRIENEVNTDAYINKKKIISTLSYSENVLKVNSNIISKVQSFFDNSKRTLSNSYYGSYSDHTGYLGFNDDFTQFVTEGSEFKPLLLKRSDYLSYILLEDKKARILLDSSSLLNIYEPNGDLFFTGNGFRGAKNDFVDVSYSGSSFLQEGKISYIFNNLGNMTLNLPWVEGVLGSGIGEKIYINSTTRDLSQIIVSNGFVSTKKNNLYEKNNRLKEIKVYDTDLTFVMYIDLFDTPNPQHFVLPFDSKNIVIEIVDVYKGSDWDDTCVNFIKAR